MKSLWSLIVCLAAYGQDGLPPGEGKDVVERVCAPCHGVYPLMQRNRSKTAWERTVEGMEARGAKGTEADFKLVVQYLTDHFGVPVVDKINVNKASSRSLTSFLNLFPEQADSIVEYREKNGSFRDFEDLKKVPGVDAKKLEAKKESITF